MNNHKSEYGVIQTIRFMIRQAAKEAPAVLVWLVVDAILALILQLLELYVTPVLLRDIEEQIALKELVTTILLFSGGILLLTGLKEYINNATYQGKIEIRMSLCKAITAKIGATSYCNLGKKDFQEKRERTNQATNSNHSATEIIWTQLNQLLFCMLGFFAYLLVMKRMNVLILAVTILAAAVSYLAVQRSVVWLQNNRAENDHARQCFWYLRDEAWSPVAAKDIRILHMKQWLLDTMKQNYEIFMHFERALGNHHFMADSVNVFAALIRNVVAYAYLIGQVLVGNMDAPQFILYFSSVSGFTNWVQGIMENVAQSVEEIDYFRVKEAVKDAGLQENIERLPEQYETKLGRSVHLDAYELSGGETQRLMLARALYRNAPVIVLDEPTAALDPIAESDLYERYHELTKGSTSIYVSHRLASTKFCDRIILIGAGGIAEMGTHEELMEAGKEYAHLYEVQSRYYTEGGMEDAAFDV